MRYNLKVKSNMFSSTHIENEVLTITYEHPYSDYHCERRFQANISPSDQSLEKQEEELIDSMIKTQEFKGKYHDVLRNSSSGTIQNKVIPITSEHPSY